MQYIDTLYQLLRTRRGRNREIYSFESTYINIFGAYSETGFMKSYAYPSFRWKKIMLLCRIFPEINDFGIDWKAD